MSSACATTEPLDPWPRPSPALVQQMHVDAAWDKRRYFRRMAERTGWTSKSYGRSAHIILRGAANLSICAIGDSITREISSQLSKVLDRPNQYSRLNHFKLKPDDVHTSCSAPSSRCSPKRCSAYLIGGLSLHWMTRNASMLRTTAQESVEAHARYFEHVLERAAYFSQEHARPVLLVGSGEVDEDTLLSAPSKSDWDVFLPFALLKLWRAAELRIFRSFTQLSSARPRVHYFDVGSIWARYPGVRCDGIHLASEFYNFSEYAEMLRARRESNPSTTVNQPTAASPHAHRDCSKSTGVYDFHLLRALEDLGLLECERCDSRSACTWRAVQSRYSKAGQNAGAFGARR